MAAIGCLEVEQLHAESAPGQFEIVTGHKDAMEVSLLAVLPMRRTAGPPDCANETSIVTALIGLHTGRQRTALRSSDLLWPHKVMLTSDQGASTHWTSSKG